MDERERDLRRQMEEFRRAGNHAHNRRPVVASLHQLQARRRRRLTRASLRETVQRWD